MPIELIGEKNGVSPLWSRLSTFCVAAEENDGGKLSG